MECEGRRIELPMRMGDEFAQVRCGTDDLHGIF